MAVVQPPAAQAAQNDPNTNGAAAAQRAAGAGGGSKLSVLNTITPYGLPQGQFLALQAAAQALQQSWKMPGLIHLDKQITPVGGTPDIVGDVLLKLTHNNAPGEAPPLSSGMPMTDLPRNGGGERHI